MLFFPRLFFKYPSSLLLHLYAASVCVCVCVGVLLYLEVYTVYGSCPARVVVDVCDTCPHQFAPFLWGTTVSLSQCYGTTARAVAT